MAGMKHTKAYLVWKTHSQQMLDFAVLVTSAVPQLDHALKQHALDPNIFLVTNPGFRPSREPFATEKRTISSHRDILGATLVISIFSYFETYFFSVIDEIIEFHGGAETMGPQIMAQFHAADARPMSKATNYLRTLFNPGRIDRYRKFSAEARKDGIMWPSERFMLYGFKQMLEQKKRWKPADIPNVIQDLLGISLSEKEKNKFHEIRGNRNKVAHGKTLAFNLKNATEASNFLLELSRRIEEGVLSKFLIIERYAH